ncbi:hypothetical protein [Dictyobacter kobayashii]|uniref:Uncharacterized protein n=1 Tax=Dictyobacter kobayashii TaxID=2014872 RepID=A0A402AXY3_9CHLR|nr:hypothetical protein [Dictyobacter kobayashii]GCE23939.1 hypothetical protein KDK_77390 [Dictyobacter kobayashii]
MMLLNSWEIFTLYPLDGAWNVKLLALRMASVASSTVNNLVVLYALRCPGLIAASVTAVAVLTRLQATYTKKHEES